MLEFLLAAALMMGAHEGSHFNTSDDAGAVTNWEGSIVRIYANNPRKYAYVAGAGIRGQDRIGNAVEATGIGREMRLVSAINKIGYVILPKGLWGNSNSGDVYTMQRYHGGPVRGMIAVSAAFDLYKVMVPDRRWSMEFWQARTGAPGLLFTYRY
jgi:hypothetical protein